MSGVFRLHPEPGEPAVRSPQLRGLVEMARVQRVPTVKVSAEELTLEWSRARSRQRWTMGAMVAAAAVLVGAFMTVKDRAPAEPPTPAQVAQVAAPVPDVEPKSVIEQPRADNDADAKTRRHVAVRLAPGVRVEPIGAATQTDASAGSPVTVHSTWSVEVAAGVYEVEVPSTAPQVLEVVVQKRTLEVGPGSTVELTAGPEPVFVVRDGTARWVDPPAGQTRSPKDSAAALARKAESELAAGNRGGAVKTLDKLVRKHPRSTVAKSAVLDLARLHRAAGDEAKARCAYQMYLDRWPTTRLRPDVERSLDKLGEGPACRGLDPR